MMELWITLPNNFDELLREYKQSVFGDVTIEQERVSGVPSYNKDSSVMSFGKQSLQIPLGSNQSVLCAALFDVPHGEWLLDSSVRSNFYTDSETAFYSAIRAINKAVMEAFGIEEMLKYEASRVRIRKELF